MSGMTGRTGSFGTSGLVYFPIKVMNNSEYPSIIRAIMLNISHLKAG